MEERHAERTDIMVGQGCPMGCGYYFSCCHIGIRDRGYDYLVYHFVDHSPKVAACVLLVPVLVHGTYDALAMSGIVSPVVGGLSFFVLIYFCVKMHKVAKVKVLALVEKDNDRIKV